MRRIVPILPINTNNPIIKILVVFEIGSIGLFPTEGRACG